MARKNLFSSSNSEKKLTVVNSPEAKPQRIAPPGFAARGALGSVTRTFDELAARAEAAREIEARLTSGEVVVELDPNSVDPSFLTDRLSQDDDDFRALVAAIESRGQDSPILVRPHPNTSGRFQVAFGRRRLKAAKELSRPVRAVVKTLSDRELVLAQGQENSARANLSFIERALFARRLEESGYDRETIMAALSVDKTVVSRMISVASQIPMPIIEAIGAAPGTGRDRWLEFASALKIETETSRLVESFGSEASRALTSDQRFDLALTLLSDPTTPSPLPPRRGRRISNGQFWSSPNGVRVARISSTERAFVLSIDKRSAPGFGDFLLAQMNRLYETFNSEREEE
jgi:ParB family transcriptional regulator, chromosome partitioning protein